MRPTVFHVQQHHAHVHTKGLHDQQLYAHVTSVADPCHVDTDPGSEKIRYGSGSRPNFSMGPDPGKKEFCTKKILKI